MRTPTGNRWVWDNYITRCHRRLESAAVPVGDRMPAEWEPVLDWGLGPSVTHGWAAQPECEKSAAMVRTTWGQYVAVHLHLTSHIQETSTLLRIKCCKRYIFIKKCVCSFIEVRHYCWLCFHLYLYMYYEYTTYWIGSFLLNFSNQVRDSTLRFFDSISLYFVLWYRNNHL